MENDVVKRGAIITLICRTTRFSLLRDLVKNGATRKIRSEALTGLRKNNDTTPLEQVTA